MNVHDSYERELSHLQTKLDAAEAQLWATRSCRKCAHPIAEWERPACCDCLSAAEARIRDMRGAVRLAIYNRDWRAALAAVADAPPPAPSPGAGGGK